MVWKQYRDLENLVKYPWKMAFPLEGLNSFGWDHLWLFFCKASVLKTSPWTLSNHTEIHKTKARLSDKTCAWSAKSFLKQIRNSSP